MKLEHSMKLACEAGFMWTGFKQDCLKKLLKTVRTTRRISEFIRQRVPDRRTSKVSTMKVYKKKC